MARRDWSERENRWIVRDYFTMLLEELRGRPFNKRDHNRTLSALLDARSPGSIERKHQNISAVMQRLGHPMIDGYKPFGHAQHALEGAVLSFLEEHPSVREEFDRISLAIPDWKPASNDAEREVMAPSSLPPDEQRRRGHSPAISFIQPRADYAVRDHENRKLGRLGEEFVYGVERSRLVRVGREDLAERVEWTANDRGDGFGYDVVSFTPQGEPVYIEVKTTNFGLRTPFYLTNNELCFSQEESRRFRLVRLFSFSSEERRAFYALRGAIDRNCRLDAVAYRAVVGA